MERPRPALSVCLAVITLTAGCTTGVGVLSGTPTPKSLPDPPERVTNDTAGEYVTTAEKAHIYNRLLGGQPTDSQLHCDPIILYAATGVRVVHVTCTGGIQFDDMSHADVAAKTLYWVEHGNVHRVSTHPEDATTRGYTADYSQNTSGYNIFNLDDQAHNVTVTLDYGGTRTPVSTFNYSLGPERSVRHHGIPFEDANTTYTVTIQTTGETRSFRWYPARTAGAMGPLLLVYVTPDGKLVHSRLPPLEAREGY